MLCNKFGARRLLSGGLAICAFATFLFGLTTYFSIAVISRIIMGITTSVAYLGALWVSLLVRLTAFRHVRRSSSGIGNVLMLSLVRCLLPI